MSSPPFVRRMPLAAANTARSFPTATATVTAASYTQKTSTEVAVATAFPELVNMSDSSFFDHWNSVDFSQDYPDEEYSSRYLVSDSDDDNDMELQRHNRKKQPPVDLDISAAQSLLDNSIYTSPDIDPNIDNNIDDMEDPPTNRGRESASMTPTLRVIPVFARSKRRSVNHEPTNTRTPPTTASTTSTPTTGHATRNTHNYHNDTSTLTDWFTPYRRTDEDVEEPSNGIVVGGGGGAPRDCQNRLHPKQPTLYHNPPLLLAVWEKILIALVLIAVAFCLFVTIALIVHHTTGRGGRIQWILGGNHDAPPTTTNATTVTAQPSNINTTSSPKPDDIDTSNQERWETIRAWLPNSSSNAITTSTSSSTATGLGTFALNALSWLVHGDLPTILGPLPSHQEFEFFQAKQKSLQGANNDNIEMAFLTPYNISSDDEEQQQLYTYLESFSCHVTQRFALLVLFFAILESSGGVPLGGWASVTGARLHECLWPGVICLRDHDYLSALELDTSIGMLEGSLPTELGLLTHLESLRLADNGLTGEIPLSLYSLTNLHTLRLTNSELSATLSPSIGSLKNLVVLELTDAGFGGTIPTEIGLLENLKFLFLSENLDLTGSIPTEVAELRQLEKVSLHATMLSGSVPEALCEFRQTGHLEYFTANCIGNYTYYLDDESDEPPMEIADTDNSSGPLPYMACTCCTLCF